MSHVLVVGGTGMLKGVSLYFATHGMKVSVIARDQNKFEELILSKDIDGFINPIRVDYSESEQLRSKLTNALNIYGPIETAVCWIHSTAPEAVHEIAEILNDSNIPVKFYHILGSESSNPAIVSEDFKQTLYKFKNISYKKIILGFVVEDENSRWLTNTEISNGVIDALKKDDEMFIVGKVEPSELRP
ncbi:MAG TPA: short-chain dehydrogenase [Ignavibacteria bacterium]|nr:short-chain dehydrogenase [Ignavibacteria bacterium]